MAIRCLFLMLVIAVCFPLHADDESYNGYGGYVEVRFAPSGYFYTMERDGLWWLVDPVGNGFISKGVNRVRFEGEVEGAVGRTPYGETVREKFDYDEDAWAQSVHRRLNQWGFNTLGTGSGGGMRRQAFPFVVSLDLGVRAAARLSGQSFPDVFSRLFEARVGHTVTATVRRHAYDSTLIGYLSDTRLEWPLRSRPDESWIVRFLQLPERADGYEAVLRFLRLRYSSMEAINNAWDTRASSLRELGQVSNATMTAARRNDEEAFVREITRRYSATCHAELVDEQIHHLFLGSVLSVNTRNEVFEEMAPYCDVIAVSAFLDEPLIGRLNDIHAITGKPLLLVSLTGEDSTWRKVIEQVMELPFVVGYHWRQYSDTVVIRDEQATIQPLGLVQWNDVPREARVAAWSELNRKVEELRVDAAQQRSP